MSDLPRYPDLTNKTVEQQIQELNDHVISLQRYIAYALDNIDSKNMTQTASGDFLKIKGLYTEVTADETGLLSRMTNAEGDVTEITQNVNGLTSDVQANTGNISTLQQTVDGLSFSVKDKDGNPHTINVSSGTGSVDLQNLVFNVLSASGSTTINGDNITTGKLSADRISGGTIQGLVINGCDIQVFDNNKNGIDLSGGIISFGSDGEYIFDEVAEIRTDYSTNSNGNLLIKTMGESKIVFNSGNGSLTAKGNGVKLFPPSASSGIGGFIDFHYNEDPDNNPSAFTSRIIDASDALYFNTNSTSKGFEFDASGANGNIKIEYPSGYTVLGGTNESYCQLGKAALRWRVVYAVNGTIQTSDKRRKTDVSYDLEKIKQVMSKIVPLSFRYNDIENDKTRFGFFAQDFETALNESGLDAADIAGLTIDEIDPTEAIPDGKLYGISYEQFIPVAIGMIQDLQKENADLKARVEALESKE